jgi:hypothetical protein
MIEISEKADISCEESCSDNLKQLGCEVRIKHWLLLILYNPNIDYKHNSYINIIWAFCINWKHCIDTSLYLKSHSLDCLVNLNLNHNLNHNLKKRKTFHKRNCWWVCLSTNRHWLTWILISIIWLKHNSNKSKHS